MRSVWRSSGNDFEVNLVPDLKILHDAGYNVLAYDLRDFGHSGAANGGIASSGIFEARDVLGSLNYARRREDTRKMAVGFSNAATHNWHTPSTYGFLATGVVLLDPAAAHKGSGACEKDGAD
jgi:pimeloyl-ACP methyl ester carboxylesterase